MKVDSALYESHLRDDLLPACNDMYPEGNFIFVQDGAPSHTAKKCQEFLRQELGDQFVDKLNWPPYSPDCNRLVIFFGMNYQIKCIKDVQSYLETLQN